MFIMTKSRGVSNCNGITIMQGNDMIASNHLTSYTASVEAHKFFLVQWSSSFDITFGSCVDYFTHLHC